MIFRPINSYLTLLDAEGLLVSYDVTDVTKTVRHYSFNSKDVTGGTLFVAKGVHFKKEYLDEAFSRGAVAYVAAAPVAGCGECIIVSDVRRAMAVLAREFWGDPSGELELFAITGTKGKSTTSFFLKYILDGDAERKGGSVCGLSTTVDQFDGKTHKYPMNTTPESPDLYRLLHAGTENGLDRFVVECSSQALKYDRVWGLEFAVAAITNVGYDHISPSEQPDFDEYFSSKLSIFDRCRVACVNLDDPHADKTAEYASRCERVVTFGFSSGADVRATDIECGGAGSRFTVNAFGESERVSLPMAGKFNVSNALCAAAMALSAGVPLSVCAGALSCAKVGGRMECHESADGKVRVIIDFAHNELSFRALFNAVERDYPGYAVITVAGWYGGKAQNRRKEVGLLTAVHSDLTVITEKDSGDEPFSDIASEVGRWIASAGGRYAVFENRRAALEYAFAVDTGERKKLILLCGQGADRWIKRGGEFVPTPSDNDNLETVMEKYDREHPGGKSE